MIWLVVGIAIFIGLVYIEKTSHEKKELKEKQDMIDKTLLEHRFVKTNLFELPNGNTIVNDGTKNKILFINNDKSTRCIDHDDINGITLYVGHELIKTYTMPRYETDKKAYYDRNKPNREPVEAIYLELEVNTVSFIDIITIPIYFDKSIEKGSAKYIKTFDMANNVYKLFESIAIKNNKKRSVKKRHKSYGQK